LTSATEAIVYTRSEKVRTLAAVLLGYLFDGYDLQIISYVLVPMSHSLNTSVGTIAVAITYSLVGSVIGGLFFGWLADRMGRRNTLLLTILTFAIFTLLTGFATSVSQVYLLRFLAGFGIGGEWGVGFSMLNEAWSEKTRGTSGGFLQSMFEYGLLIAATSAGILIGRFGAAEGWRYAFMVAGLLALALLSLRFIMPESKVWNRYNRLKEEGALPQGYDVRSPMVQIFSRGVLKWTVLVSFFSAFALFSGYSMIVFMPTYLGAGGLHLTISQYTPIITLALLIGTPAYWLDGWLSDRIGRRRTAQLFISLLLLTLVAFYYEASHPPAYNGILTYPFFYILIGFDAFVGYFAHMGVWYGEIFPTRMRATGTNFAYAVVGRGLGAGLAPIIIPALAMVGGYGMAMALASGVSALIALILTLLIKETKGTVITPV
jgi:SHS family lactate transporter-like MFS transporter